MCKLRDLYAYAVICPGVGVGARDLTRRIRDATRLCNHQLVWLVAKLVVSVWPRHSGVEGQCQQVYGHD